jgi:hypothetical protein
LPHRATIFACDEEVRPGTAWQTTTTISLRRHNEVVEGRLRNNVAGIRPINVHTAYYDVRKDPILTELGTNLTNPVRLGQLHVPAPDMTMNFRYRMGTHLHENPAQLWYS